jgi:hypothetical protein
MRISPTAAHNKKLRFQESYSKGMKTTLEHLTSLYCYLI